VRRRGHPESLEVGLWSTTRVSKSTGASLLGGQYNGCEVAAGDAQRVWFPEMIEKLRSQWRQDLSFDAIVELRDELDAMLQQIRSERHIRPPVFKCPKCGHVGEGADAHVSVRAMILSLVRFGIAAAETTYMIEKRWAGYRKERQLDLYGKGVAPKSTHLAGCGHPQVRQGDFSSNWITSGLPTTRTRTLTLYAS
jgi:hypothetical protein